MTRQSPAADALGPKEVLETQELGRRAAHAGHRVDTCPWKTPATERETALREMWIRGYAQGLTELRQASGAPETPRQSPD